MTPQQLAAYGKKVKTEIGPLIKRICEKNDIFYGDFDGILYRLLGEKSIVTVLKRLFGFVRICLL